MKEIKGQIIDGIPMAEYLAHLAVELDNAEVEKEKMQLKLQVIKQLNNHHKNIIDAQRVELKIEQLQHETSKF